MEIAIDEYQDSNLLQEYLLNMIARGNNIFMVGDVKQSIYKFRQKSPVPVTTMPKISGTSVKKIQLYKNFRSRKQVLDFTNLIFDNIMSEKLGEIDYNEEEYLNLGAEYSENEQMLLPEINIIDTMPKISDTSDNNSVKNLRYE